MACHFTHVVLIAALRDSGFGTCARAFRAFFTEGSEAKPVCNLCRRFIGEHPGTDHDRSLTDTFATFWTCNAYVSIPRSVLPPGSLLHEAVETYHSQEKINGAIVVDGVSPEALCAIRSALVDGGRLQKMYLGAARRLGISDTSSSNEEEETPPTGVVSRFSIYTNDKDAREKCVAVGRAFPGVAGVVRRASPSRVDVTVNDRGGEGGWYEVATEIAVCMTARVLGATVSDARRVGRRSWYDSNPEGSEGWSVSGMGE